MPNLLRKCHPGEHRCSWYWLAECECGNTFFCQPTDVIKGKVKSCGCSKTRKGRTNFRNWTDARVGFLDVLGELPDTTRAGLVVWECRCTYLGCGRIVALSSELLRKGTESCGCLAADVTHMRHLEREISKYKECNDYELKQDQ